LGRAAREGDEIVRKLVVAVVGVLALVGAGSVLAFATQQPDRSSHSATLKSNDGQNEQGTVNSSTVSDNDTDEDTDEQGEDRDEQGEDRNEQGDANQSKSAQHKKGSQDNEKKGQSGASDVDR